MTDPTWKMSAIHPGLRPGEIHLWRISLHRDVEVIGTRIPLLSCDEHARMQQFRFDVHRERFALRRGALRILLGRYLGIAAPDIRIRYSARGKPELESRPGPHTLRFNLSDSADLAVVAVALDMAVGVDVEQVRPIPEMDGIARAHFSAREYEAYRGVDAADRQAAFFNCWTRKEAWLKAKGEGLTWDLTSFDVSLVPGESPRLLSVSDAPSEAGRWMLYSAQVGDDAICALAADCLRPTIGCFEYLDS